MKYLGPYNFTVYDGVKTIENNQQKALASEDDLTKVLNYTKQRQTEPNPEYYGVAKKKNIIKIHLESFQTFLINKKVNGKEVTPFLNKLSSGKSNSHTSLTFSIKQVKVKHLTLNLQWITVYTVYRKVLPFH